MQLTHRVKKVGMRIHEKFKQRNEPQMTRIYTTKHRGRCAVDCRKAARRVRRVGTSESNIAESAGLRPEFRAGAAFSNPSTSKLPRECANTSPTRSATGPALALATRCFVAKGLMDAGWDVVLVEPGPSGARNARKRGLEHVVCGTTHTAGFKNGSFPAIGVFDVVEHIEHDLGFLRHLWDLLEPGGMLYLTVPAYNFLWSHEDVDAGHFRRYTLGAMEEKLREVGLEPVFGTYIFSFLPLPVFLFRTVPYKLGLGEQKKAEKISPKDHVVQGGVSRLLLNKLLGIELRHIKRAKALPFGGSCMIAAKKK